MEKKIQNLVEFIWVDSELWVSAHTIITFKLLNVKKRSEGKTKASSLQRKGSIYKSRIHIKFSRTKRC